MGGEGYNYNLHLPQRLADRLTGEFRALGISRSAVLRAAIDSIPLRLVLGTPRPLVRTRELMHEQMIRVGFAISEAQRQKLDQIQAAGYESADILRSALEPYLALPIAELEKIPSFFRAHKRQAQITAARAAARALRGGEDPPTGDGAHVRAQLVKDAAKKSIAKAIDAAPAIPVRAPSLDWSKTGPVRPKPEKKGNGRATKALARLNDLKRK